MKRTLKTLILFQVINKVTSNLCRKVSKWMKQFSQLCKFQTKDFYKCFYLKEIYFPYFMYKMKAAFLFFFFVFVLLLLFLFIFFMIADVINIWEIYNSILLKFFPRHKIMHNIFLGIWNILKTACRSPSSKGF